jgi:hypothetical protein
MKLPGAGMLQDGGVRANCPLRTAIRESEIIWPSSQRPDLVISIGTGFPYDGSQSNLGDSTKEFWRGRFVERAIRTFLCSPSVDGRRGWQDALDGVPESVRPDVFRLDRELQGELPELDDALTMDELENFDYHIPGDLSRAWHAKSLFLELDAEPFVSRGCYKCQASILCCRYNAVAIIESMLSLAPGARFLLSDGSDLGAVEEDDGCSFCGYYRKRVSFQVSSLCETVILGVQSTAGFSAIGGFPTSIQQLLEAQQADAPFGRIDHRGDCWPPARHCYCDRRKRVRSSISPEPCLKRRRSDNGNGGNHTDH